MTNYMLFVTAFTNIPYMCFYLPSLLAEWYCLSVPPKTAINNKKFSVVLLASEDFHTGCYNQYFYLNNDFNE